MVRYRTLVGIAFVLLLTSCGPSEQLPKPETVLPKGYSEKRVPNDFVKEIGLDFKAGEVWMRCIDCTEDWEELNAHVLSVLEPQGYKDSTSEWLAAMNKASKLPSEANDVMGKACKTYSSKLGQAHILLIDIKGMNEMGAGISTSGDFLILASIDDIKSFGH